MEEKKLKTVYCSWLPMKGYIAMTVLCWMVVRKDQANKLSPVVINHEHIHYAQERELWYIGFYILYAIMFVANLLVMWNWKRAYRRIPFEAEAYDNQSRLDYLQYRRRFAWRDDCYLSPREEAEE